jgi:hypothetical protein
MSMEIRTRSPGVKPRAPQFGGRRGEDEQARSEMSLTALTVDAAEALKSPSIA